MRIAIAIILLLSGCAPHRFTLMRDSGRELLLPPGVKRAPTGPQRDCDASPPLTPRASHFALHGCYVTAGYVDLQPGMRLNIVRPRLAPGETAVKTETVAQSGLNLTVRSNVVGVDTEHVAIDPGTAAKLGLPDSASHLRLFFLARDLDGGRKITLIGAASRAELDRVSTTLEAYCAAPSAPCLAVSRGMVIGAEIPVTVQGKLTYFPLGASVREAVPKDITDDRLQLTRLWHGKPATVRRETGASISGLPLNAADSISWR